MEICCLRRPGSFSLLMAACRVRNLKPHPLCRPPFVLFGGKSCRKAEFLENVRAKAKSVLQKSRSFNDAAALRKAYFFPEEPLDGKQSKFLEKGRNSIVFVSITKEKERVY